MPRVRFHQRKETHTNATLVVSLPDQSIDELLPAVHIRAHHAVVPLHAATEKAFGIFVTGEDFEKDVSDEGVVACFRSRDLGLDFAERLPGVWAEDGQVAGRVHLDDEGVEGVKHEKAAVAGLLADARDGRLDVLVLSAWGRAFDPYLSGHRHGELPDVVAHLGGQLVEGGGIHRFVLVSAALVC